MLRQKKKIERERDEYEKKKLLIGLRSSLADEYDMLIPTLPCSY
jgi:hypothetical protein